MAVERFNQASRGLKETAGRFVSKAVGIFNIRFRGGDALEEPVFPWPAGVAEKELNGIAKYRAEGRNREVSVALYMLDETDEIYSNVDNLYDQAFDDWLEADDKDEQRLGKRVDLTGDLKWDLPFFLADYATPATVILATQGVIDRPPRRFEIGLGIFTMMAETKLVQEGEDVETMHAVDTADEIVAREWLVKASNKLTPPQLVDLHINQRLKEVSSEGMEREALERGRLRFIELYTKTR